MSSDAQRNGERSESRHERSASARGAKDWGGGASEAGARGEYSPPTNLKTHVFELRCVARDVAVQEHTVSNYLIYIINIKTLPLARFNIDSIRWRS